MDEARRISQLTLFDLPPDSPARDPRTEIKPAAGFDDFEATLLALANVKGLGHKSLKALVDAFDGDLAQVWGADRGRLLAILENSRTPSAATIVATLEADREAIRADGRAQLDRLRDERGIHLIQGSRLPDSLRSIPDDPPRWLFIEGDKDILRAGPFVAVVGTRSATERGIKAAERVSRLIARYPEIVLVSGLAEGIDAAAHSSSVKLGVRNLAFLGHGINFVFPEATRDLRADIIESNGAVATEYLPNEKYQKAFFVRRNRLQAGIADLVIPVEAGSQSGTAHTVNFARSFGRDLVGLGWPESAGVAADLARDGFKVIDIFEDGGVKQLDFILRGLVERVGGEAYAFARTEETFLRELNTRNARLKDVQRLLKTIRDMTDDLSL